ncbi:MAG: SGNH/GDSL hydrolase family protein [Candidatus Marinimicrobia bacterium]|nr:SGNH/GDSL hydrolase family protein [Candidatus Neomarinimicrobiota bacterium]
MRKSLCFLFLLLGVFLFAVEPVYYDAQLFLEGMAFDDAPPFSRLPVNAEGMVRKPVWDLSRNSAGVAAHFFTDATEIHIQWEVLNDFHMVHMAGTGIRGLDLYVKHDKNWFHLGTGKPYKAENERRLIKNLTAEKREYLLYCPLYDGLRSLNIGINPEAEIRKIERNEKPLVFYGTSITQGGCVTRPGMAYPAIIGRKLEKETINLGFSGNGHMDPEIIDYILEIDAECYIFDNFPNMDLEMIKERTERELYKLLDRRPNTPVLIVPNIMAEDAWFDPEIYNATIAKNEELITIYKRLKTGHKNLHMIPFKQIRHVAVEGTVDGIHLTDLGALKMAKVLEKNIKRIIR